jgi:PTH1 family peptidyl-tRNA hydrolase
MMRASNRSVLLVKPQTFMNRSGDCLAALTRKYRFEAGELLVVVDDVDLPVGQIRIRPVGGAGGHNGLRSVIDRVGSKAFPRVRLGVGLRPAGAELVDFVLGRFAREDREAADAMVRRAADAVETAVEKSVQEAMNGFNGA